jgi:hypothetical protein
VANTLPYYRKVIGCKVSSKNEKLYKNIENVDVCETPDCVKKGSVIQSFIDSNVPPCKNVMLHACGEFNKKPLNDRYEAESMSEINTRKLNEQFRRVLIKEVEDDEIFPKKIVKKYFIECTGKDCEFFKLICH